jgi:hypothetical protein
MHQADTTARSREQAWLSVASLIVAAFGLAVALAAHPALAPTIGVLVDLLIWPLDGAQSLASPEARLLAAVGGGVMLGWGVMLWLVANRLYARDPALARSMVLTSVGAWFVVDSLASVMAGVPLDVLGNVAFLAMLVWPVWKRPELGGRPA